MKIILFGGSGLLGKELLGLDADILAPSHEDVDITSSENIYDYFLEHRPDIVINAAAVTDNRAVERNPSEAMRVNIQGACYIATACNTFDARLVYISTDYIYKGDRGNYKETDEILPFNLYSWTKLGGEAASRCVKNHLIIRTSFGPNKFPYPISFTDKWSSKDYVDVLAPKILDAAVSPLTGVLNLGTARKSLYQHARERNTLVKPMRLKESQHRSPVDSSLNLQKWLDYRSTDSVITPHIACRCCGGMNLSKYLDLGVMPLANNLEPTAELARNVERFPLQVMLCRDCGLSQLSVVVSPRKMFSYYVYRSGVNGGYVKHCRQMAKDFMKRYNLGPFNFHIDIAGNDGTLLKQFQNEIPALACLNIDPAVNLCAIAEQNGIPSKAAFWSPELAESILKDYGLADLITATNVFAHVNDIQGFLFACSKVMGLKGVTVLEFPYVLEFLKGGEFDTVYFEHVSYMGLYPISIPCKQMNLEITNAELWDIHGGTMRVEISHVGVRDVAKGVTEAIEAEKRVMKEENFYDNWEQVVEERKKEFSAELLKLKKAGAKISAFAASAKGNTLLNTCGINTDIIDYIVDETPEKVGKFSPGTGISIVGKHVLEQEPPEYLIILSWNFAEEIMTKCRQSNYKGKFIIPIPTFQVIE